MPDHASSDHCRRLEQRHSLFDRIYQVGSGETRFLAIDGLRGLAAVLVFLVHYAALAAAWTPPNGFTADLSRVLHAAGHIGVYVFFVISGFLIYGSLIRRRFEFWRYLRRRLQRLYPTFLAVLATYLGLFVAVPSESKLPAEPLDAAGFILANLLLLPGVVDITPIITVAWSLSYELLFYIVIPAVVAGLALRDVAPAVRLGVFMLGWGLILLLTPDHFAASIFIVGILVVEAERRYRAWPPGAWYERIAATAFAIAMAVFVVITQDWVAFDHADLIKNLILFLACYLLFVAIVYRRGALNRVLTFRALRYLGNISYSFYLIHGLCLKFLFFVLPILIPIQANAGWFWGLLAPAFLLSAMAATGLFLLVERPLSLDGIGAWSLLRRVPAPTWIGQANLEPAGEGDRHGG